jgi:hypothetical protein
MQETWDIQSISTLYEETDAINHTNMRLKGAIKVQACLDSAVSRESQWERKGSTVVRCDERFKTALNDN